MFRAAIYCNVFLLFIISIYFLEKTNSEKSDLKKIRKLICVHFMLNILNGYASKMTDIGYGTLILLPLLAITFVIHIVSICRIRKKIKQRGDAYYNVMSIKKFIIVTIIPVIILVAPFAYELYILNNCEYMLRYNYQVGFINSEDTYIAIINNKPVTVTLQTNIFDREGTSTNNLHYGIIYTNDIEISNGGYGGDKAIVEDEDIKQIALDAFERCPSAKGATIYYFPEGKYAFIRLREDETHGTVLGEYFYYNKYIQKSNIPGDIDEVIYYK